ncbi:MAG: methyltransferase family protein [Succinivibrio sp.]
MLREILAYIAGTILLFILVPAGAVYLGTLYPIDFMPENRLSSVFGAVCSAAGLFFVIWANYEIITKGKGGAVAVGPVKLSRQTRNLVTTGPYALCRNPMHMGIVLFYLGLCCAINSLVTLIIPLGFQIFAWFNAVFFDEPRLKREFKDEYTVWVQKVPQRFWPKPKKG